MLWADPGVLQWKMGRLCLRSRWHEPIKITRGGGGPEDLERTHPGHQEDMQTPGMISSADFNNCDYNLWLRCDQLSVQHSPPPEMVSFNPQLSE